MSKATRIKQAIRITVISTLVFYFGLIALLNLPAVQHRISTYAARELTVSPSRSQHWQCRFRASEPRCHPERADKGPAEERHARHITLFRQD